MNAQSLALPVTVAMMLACSDAPAKQSPGIEPSAAQGAGETLVAAKTDAPVTPGNFVRLKRVEIMDRHGFEKPMRAASLLIPSDWTMQDQVVWAMKPGATELVQMTFTTRSADNLHGLDMLPAFTWGWSDNPMMQQSMQMAAQNGGTPAMPPMQSREFLTNIAVPNVRRGAKIIGFDKIPGVDEALGKHVQDQRQMAAQVGMQLDMRVEHARAHLQYQENGKAIDEWLTAAVFTTAIDNRAMGFGMSYVSTAQYVFAFRAPPGELAAQDKLFQMILSTLAVDPQWQARVNQANANIQRINAKGAADRAKIVADTNAEINRTITEGYDSRQKSQDRAHENFTDYIRGVQRYQDPTTGEQMKLTSGYNHAWSSGNGEYVFTDTQGWNPGAVLKGNWTELKAIPNP